MTPDTPTQHCPLCGGEHTVRLDVIEGAALNDAWLRSFGIRAGIQAAEVEYRRCSDCALQYFTPPEDGDASLYETLQKQDWYYLTDKPEYALARRHLPPTGRVLEVGAGKAAFAKICGPERYLGLEFNDAAISRAAGDGIRLVKQPIQSHAVEQPEHYDAVVSFQVLEHVADPAGFVAGCVAALAPGGTMILAVPDNDGLCGMAQNNILDMPPHHVSHWNERSLRFIAARHQLTAVAIEREPVSELHQAWARRAVAERFLRRAVGLSPRQLDHRLPARAVGWVSARVAEWIRPDTSRVTGHTILGIFRKA